MYASSTHRKSWTFGNENELNQLRISANAEYIDKHKNDEVALQSDPSKIFLSAIEERHLVRQYEVHLRDFCRR